ncbi:DNA internalization-related competence protein ComEC/Rec2 [Bacillus manliponensis]|uniref:DNA internalization-related competence protein ComEC/Rec2 n=1 Tax=Bacillus manliponensis TaxID=574376 RepID=UPI0035138ABD
MQRKWGYIAISIVFGITMAIFSLSMFLIVLLCCYLAFCLYRNSYHIFFFVIFACTVSYVYTSYVHSQNVPRATPGELMLQATIDTTPLIDGDRLTARIKGERGERLQLSYKISSHEQKEKLIKLQPGMVCVFQGEQKEPPRARNFHAFDYHDYLLKRYTHFIFEAATISHCVQQETSFVHWLLSLRQSSVSHIADVLPKQSAAFMNALLFGDRQHMTSDVEDQYQLFGLVHLLAISGSHIVLLTAICYFILLRVGVTRESATMVLIVCIPLYMFFAGASASVVRASLMGVIVLWTVVYTVRLCSIDAISITAIVMLFYDPYVLFDIGFQFSFVGSLALLLSSSNLLNAQENLIKSAIYVSLLSQLASMPILLYHFGYFSPYSVLLNIIYVPFLSLFVLPCSIVIALLMLLFPLLATWLAKVLSFCITLSNDLLKYCEALPFVQLTFGVTSPLLVVVYCCSILSIFLSWEGLIWKKYRSICIGIFLLISIGHYMFPYVKGTGKVTFIDVGQGDAILIRLPYEKGTYLIDTGGALLIKKEKWQQKKNNFTIGEDILIPFLRKEGVREIDKLILTHGDMDHAGAAKEVLQSIPVKEVIFGKKKQDAQLESKLKQLAHKKNIPVHMAKEGEKWIAGDAEFTILAPEGDEEGDNDASIVLFASMGNRTWLFTGDLEEKGEKELVETYPNLRADILKVGHHGSKTSSTVQFLDHVKPKVAVISAGEKNRYGHPNKEVVDRLIERGIKVWRTDEQGAVSYIFQGEKGTFQSKLTYDEAQKKKTATRSL